MLTDYKTLLPDNVEAFYHEIAKSQAWAQQSIKEKFEAKLREPDSNFEEKSVLLDKVTIHTDETVFGQLFREIVLAAYKFSDNQENVLDLLELSQKIDMSPHLDAVMQGDYQEVASRIGVSNTESISYFGEMAVQPYLRVLASKAGRYREHEWNENSCPVCGRMSAFSVRDNEGRKLVCGSCQTEWSYPYLQCSSCGSSDHAALEFLIPEGIEGEKIYTCKKCLCYIKIFDREVLQGSDMQMMHMKTMYLDLLAVSKGYTREMTVNPLVM